MPYLIGMCFQPLWRSTTRMRLRNFGVDNTPQEFYFAEDHPMMPGWFKWTEVINRERVNRHCGRRETCNVGKNGCCFRRLCNNYSHTTQLRVSPGDCGVKSAISIPITTASSTSSSSTGEPQTKLIYRTPKGKGHEGDGQKLSQLFGWAWASSSSRTCLYHLSSLYRPEFDRVWHRMSAEIFIIPAKDERIGLPSAI